MSGNIPEKGESAHRNYILSILKMDKMKVPMGGKRKIALEIRDFIRANGGDAIVILQQSPKVIE